jgi:L-methionine (R)-S-oxide reductase
MAIERPYHEIASGLHEIASGLQGEGDRTARMQAVVDRLWQDLETLGVSWVGFYLKSAGDELVLGPSRNKPACSPIGLHGACGQVFLSGQPLVVKDVRDLGAGYIACDPRDLSEVVLPVEDEQGRIWGVLDLDSFEIGAFDQRDVAGLRSVLEAAGLVPRTGRASVAAV